MPMAQAERLLKGPIIKGVGKGKPNLALDVALVQSLLNIINNLPEAKTKIYLVSKPAITNKAKNKLQLIVNGRYSQELVDEITAFQSRYCNITPDGSISPNRTTWKQLIKISGITLTKNNKLKTIFGSSFIEHIKTLTAVNKNDLKNYITKHLHIAKANEDLSNFLKNLLSDTTMTNVYWASYYLATAYHETSFSFKSIEETGKGKGKKYGTVIKVTDTTGYRGTKGAVYDNVFYGRGYIQLTWDSSYKYVSKKIGLLEDELYINPDKALETDTAYKIMTFWMQNDIPKVKGSGRKIQEHITAHGKPNYVSARKIVNGTDQAVAISNYAIILEALIRLSATK